MPVGSALADFSTSLGDGLGNFKVRQGGGGTIITNVCFLSLLSFGNAPGYKYLFHTSSSFLVFSTLWLLSPYTGAFMLLLWVTRHSKDSCCSVYSRRLTNNIFPLANIPGRDVYETFHGWISRRTALGGSDIFF